VGLDHEEHHLDVLNPWRPDESAGRDKRAFLMAIQRAKRMNELEVMCEVMSSGPLPPEGIDSFVDVYKRGLKEVETLLGSR
jgi:hypothetical protein